MRRLSGCSSHFCCYLRFFLPDCAAPQPAAGPSASGLKAKLLRGGGSAERPLRDRRATPARPSAREPPRRQRPLASNMKLFTTSTALSRFGPEATIATKVLADGTIDEPRRSPRQPLPAGRRRPGAGHAGLLRPLPRRPRHRSLRAEAPDTRGGLTAVTGRLYADDDDLRPAPRGGRLRLRDQPLHWPPLRPLAQLRLQQRRSRQLRLRPGQGRRVDAGRLAARRGHRDPARVALGDARRAAKTIAVVRSPTIDPLVNATDVFSEQLLRRDADQADRRRIRRRREHRRRERRSSSISPAARAPASTPSTARA